MPGMAENQSPAALRERPMLRQKAYSAFMSALADGVIKPGHMVSQRELSELLSLPLGPIREALKRLEAESIVKLIPQRGIEIIEVDEQVIDEVYQLRRLLELEAIDVFARDLPRQSVLELLHRTKSAIAELEPGQIDLARSKSLTDIDHAMHKMFVVALNNRFADEMHRRVLAQLQLVRFLNRIRQTSNSDALEEHVPLLEALLSGQAQTARNLLQIHLDAAHRRAKRTDLA